MLVRRKTGDLVKVKEGVRCWSEGRVMLVRKVIGGEVDLKCWTE